MMHFIMHFIGCVETVMADTALSDVMECAFGGVSHMLTLKRFPHNFRALRLVIVVVRLEHSHSFNDSLDNHSTASGPAWCRRLVVEELLRSIVLESDYTHGVMFNLQNRADENKTTNCG